MRIILMVLFVFTGYTASYAEVKVIREGLPLHRVDRAFELAAVSFESSTVMFNEQCGKADGVAYCNFNAEGPIIISAVGETKESDVHSISINYAPDDNPKPFVWNIALLVKICEPDMSKEDRGKITMDIVERFTSKEGGIIRGAHCSYNAVNLAGFIVIASPTPDTN